MKEKRKETRYPVNLQLSICDLYKQDTTGIHDLESPIDVENISRCGLCFRSECILPTDYYFNATLNLEDATEPVFTVVRIIRSEVIGRDLYRYGCEFADFPEQLKHLLEFDLVSC